MSGLFPSGAQTGPVIRGDVGTVEFVEVAFDNPVKQYMQVGFNRLDPTARDSGNTDGPTTFDKYLRPGLILGQKRADGLFKEWDPTATDGTEIPIGVLQDGVSVEQYGATPAGMRTKRVLIRGALMTEQLVMPGEDTRGITEGNYEYLLAQSFLDQGRLHLGQLDEYRRGGTVNIAANTTINAANERSFFGKTVLIDPTASNVTVTLPAPKLGYEITLIAANVDNNPIVAGASAGDIIRAADGLADATVTLAVGQTLKLVGTSIGGSVVFLETT